MTLSITGCQMVASLFSFKTKTHNNIDNNSFYKQKLDTLQDIMEMQVMIGFGRHVK